MFITVNFLLYIFIMLFNECTSGKVTCGKAKNLCADDICTVCGRTDMNGDDRCMYPFWNQYTVESVTNGYECRPVLARCSDDNRDCWGLEDHRKLPHDQHPIYQKCFEGFPRHPVCECGLLEVPDDCKTVAPEPLVYKYPNGIEIVAGDTKVKPNQRARFYNIHIIYGSDKNYINISSSERGDLRIRYTSWFNENCRETCPEADRKAGCHFVHRFTNTRKFPDTRCYLMYFTHPVKWDNVLYTDNRTAGYLVNYTLYLHGYTNFSTKWTDFKTEWFANVTDHTLSEYIHDKWLHFDDWKRKPNETLNYSNITFPPDIPSRYITLAFRQYQIFVEYPPDITCYPVIQLNNCASRREEAFAYITSDEIVIQAIVEPPGYFGDCGITKQKEYKIWHHELDQTDAPEDYYYNPVSHYEYYGSSDCLIPRFSLTKGVWKIQYRTSFYHRRTGRAYSNFNYCFVKIYYLPVVAVIHGGLERYVPLRLAVSMRADASYDPNFKDGKNNLSYSWSCKKVSGADTCLCCYQNPNKITEMAILWKSFQRINDTYNVTLAVDSLRNSQSGYTYQILVTTNVDLRLILHCISCRHQFLTDTRENTLLKLEYFDKINISDILWTYAEGGNHSYSEYKSADSIRDEETSEDLFLIPAFTLIDGKEYDIRASVSGENLRTSIRIYTPPPVPEDKCVVGPEQLALTGETLCILNCTFLLTEESFIYEVFENDESDESLFSGRMLLTSRNPVFPNFRLAYGVHVYVNEFSTSRKKVYRVKTNAENIHPFEFSLDPIEEWLVKMKANLLKYNYERVHQYASLIVILWSKNTTVPYIVTKLLLDTLEKIPLYSVADIKIHLSTIKCIADSSLNNTNGTNFSLYLASKMVNILNKITMAFVKRIKIVQYETTLTESIITQMMSFIFDILEIMMDYKDEIISENTRRYLLDPKIMDLAQSWSRTILKILDSISFSLLQRQVPGNKYTEIKSKKGNIKSCVMVSSPQAIHNIMTMKKEIIPLNMSLNVVKSVEETRKNIGIQFIRMKDNPFYWAGEKISTELFLVIFCLRSRRTSCRYESTFLHSLSMYHNISEVAKSIIPVEGTTHSVDTKKGELDRDLDVTIYRLNPPLKSKIFVQFLFKPGDNGFKVLFKKNMRANYSTMMNNSVHVTPQSPTYNIPYDSSEIDRLYYMGILPLEKMEGEVKFKAKIFYVHCKAWDSWYWSTVGCSVGKLSTPETLQCDCTHLSLFGGTVAVPVFDVLSPLTFPIFVTSHDNMLPFLLFLLTILLYIVLIPYGFLKDTKDIPMRNVIVLEDNYPEDRYGYLIGVYTGSRYGASTDAKVGCRLFGENSYSRVHVLQSSQCKIFRTNTDNWFLMFCKSKLGHLRSLYIWHDNSGKCPDWFVEKVEVFDLYTKYQYTFEIHEWIVLESNMDPEVVVCPCHILTDVSVFNITFRNIIIALRDTHLWTSILWKHPRNPVSRIVRINVLFGFVLVAMSSSIWLRLYFCKMSRPEDDPEFKITDCDILIFGISFFMAKFTSLFCLALFRKAYVSKASVKVKASLRSVGSCPYATKADSTLKSKSFSSNLLPQTSYTSLIKVSSKLFVSYSDHEIEEEEEEELKKPLLRIVDAIHKLLHGSTLLPVKLSQYPSDLLVFRKYCVAAWFLLFLLILISSVIVIACGWKLLVPVMGAKWVTIFVAILLIDIFIVSVITILIYSYIFSLTFQKTVQSTSYNIFSKDAHNLHLEKNPDYLYHLANLRSQPMYTPLPRTAKMAGREKRMRVQYWYEVMNFVLILSLLLVLLQTGHQFLYDSYHSNSHAVHMITQGHANVPGALDFLEVLNKTDFEIFMEETYLRQLYTYLWYNLDPLKKTDNTSNFLRTDRMHDYTMKLLGVVQMRQIRVMFGVCGNVPKLPRNWTEYCSPPYQPAYEDKDLYDVHWTSGGYKDITTKSTTWRFTSPSVSNSSCYYGPSATLYHAGGYIADLGRTKSETQVVLADLIQEMWLNHYTRAIFVELTLYNVNTQLFSQVVLVAEVMPTGQYLPLVKVESVSTDFIFDFWNISFVVINIFFFLRALYLMNRKGIIVYFCNPTYIHEAFQVVLGFGTAIFYFIQIENSSIYMTKFHRSGLDEFFNFGSITYYAFWSKLMMCMQTVSVVIKLFIVWRFGEIYVKFCGTFVLSLHLIFWLTLYFILVLAVIWRFIGYFLNKFVFAYYTKVILYHKDFLKLHTTNDSTVWDRVLPFSLCFLALLIEITFLVSIAFYYKLKCKSTITGANSENLLHFVSNEVMQKIRKTSTVNKDTGKEKVSNTSQQHISL